MEHNILKSLQPLFNQGLECYDVHNYSLIHMPIPSLIQLLRLFINFKVSEEWVSIAILRCIEMEKAVVEGGGASGVAAVLAGLCPELKGKK